MNYSTKADGIKYNVVKSVSQNSIHFFVFFLRKTCRTIDRRSWKSLSCCRVQKEGNYVDTNIEAEAAPNYQELNVHTSNSESAYHNTTIR